MGSTSVGLKARMLVVAVVVAVLSAFYATPALAAGPTVTIDPNTGEISIKGDVGPYR